jgi:hypothetical protein
MRICHTITNADSKLWFVYTSYQVAAIDLRHRSQDQQLIVSMVLKSFNDQGTATEQRIDIIIVIKYNIKDDYHLSIYISS